jgi:hypothetical protein
MGENKAENLEISFERREHQRFMVELPVEYRRKNDSRLRPGHTLNFSEDGFMILVSDRMQVGEELDMKIYFSSVSGLKTILANVKVIWTDVNAKEEGYYKFGVSYVGISDVDKNILKEFLNMYADPNQVPAELKPPAGTISAPAKPPPPKQRGGTLAVILGKYTFLKGLLGYGKPVIEEGRNR